MSPLTKWFHGTALHPMSLPIHTQTILQWARTVCLCDAEKCAVQCNARSAGLQRLWWSEDSKEGDQGHLDQQGLYHWPLQRGKCLWYSLHHTQTDGGLNSRLWQWLCACQVCVTGWIMSTLTRWHAPFTMALLQYDASLASLYTDTQHVHGTKYMRMSSCEWQVYTHMYVVFTNLCT